MDLSADQLEQRRRNNARIAAARRAATHCKRGHEFTEENTLSYPSGKRLCRTCRNDWYWYRRRGFRMGEWAA